MSENVIVAVITGSLFIAGGAGLMVLDKALGQKKDTIRNSPSTLFACTAGPFMMLFGLFWAWSINTS